MLTIYKASAGSGKTFQLVIEYISLLLENPNNYRHILAVTFTNKATTEMKTRILEQLDLLSQNKPSDYIEHLQKKNNQTEEFIRKRAQIVLKNILHDYNRFSVNTIDSFTQKTIRAFNRELGITPNFTVELDSDMILAEATDRMLAKIDKDKKLLDWLKDFSKEKIEDSHSQRIEEDIKKLGKELFKENFQVFFPEDSESVYSRKNLNNFQKDLKKVKSQFENSLKNLGKKAIEIMATNGLSVEDFSYGKTGVAGYLQKISEGETIEGGKRVIEAAEDVEKWYRKKSEKEREIHALAENHLQPVLQEILAFFRDNGVEYNTVVAVLKELRMLGILTDLKEEIKNLLHEKSILQMSDSNRLLSKIIGQSDSPFIYEKTGSFYHHFMLDEFQDTSGLQWNNFRPLVKNSLAEGNKNLLVGDVKQSIYRWRNSDWQILAEQVHSDFHAGQYVEKTLADNWRSDKNIIDFNNAVFESLKNTFETIQFATIDDENDFFIRKFRNVYSSIAQTPGKIKNKPEGFVNIRFLPDDDFKEQSVMQLTEQVKQLQDLGIKPSEIAILVRTNKEGTLIVEKFLQAAKREENAAYNLSVLSNESLFLHASQAVLFVIQTVKLIIDSENKIAKTALLNLYENWLIPELLRRGKPVNAENTQAQINFTAGENFSPDENFNLFFESHLQSRLNRLKQKILLTSLDETITQIASVFQLFEIETELPFLQALTDKAGELKTSLSNDLSNLLFWWDEKGYKTSVNVNEDLDSIRLLTIHKSKGLEFKAVLLPFFDWKTSMNGNNAPILWCRPATSPFNQFPLLPVKAGSYLKNSLFKTEYTEEVVNSFIDVFNLVYVAFTRAKSVLVVHCPVVKETKNPNSETSKSIHYLLLKALEQMGNNREFEDCLSHDNAIFQFGVASFTPSEVEITKSEYIKNYRFNDFGERIKLRITGENFLKEDERQHSAKNTGKLIHEILAGVNTISDIGKACEIAFKNGKITKSEEVEIEKILLKNMEKPAIKSWFNGSYNVLNERSILTSEHIYRPDRIMISEKNAVVVDYKTGEKKSESYNRQVKRYAEKLKETGFEKVEGFLWYISLDEVEKVCEV